MKEFRLKLKNIEEKYKDMFARIGHGCLIDFKKLIDSVDAYIEFLSDNRNDLFIKFFDYAKTKSDVLAFCEAYAKKYGIKTSELEADIIRLMDKVLETYT